MESMHKHSFVNNFCVWYLLLLICLHTSSTENPELGSLTDNNNSEKGKYYWWFGPRLGRGKSSGDYDYWTADPNSDQDFVGEVNKETRLTEVPLEARNHNTISFTPRLGRATEEEIEHLYYPKSATKLDHQQKHLLFSPRLG